MALDTKNPFSTTGPFKQKQFKYELKESPFVIAQRQNKLTTTSGNRRWEVTVPAASAWNPALSRHLITGLYAIQAPITLGIMATPQRFTWYIIVPDTHRNSVTQSLYALYPQAELKAHTMQAQTDYFRFPLHLARPFPSPLKGIEDFSVFDPLTPLLSALRQLRGDESVAYELMLIPAESIYRELGQQLLQEWADLDTASFNVLQAKINNPLKVVSLVIKIRAASKQRANRIVAGTWIALVQFAAPGFNALAVPGPETFQPLLTPGEVAGLWHLPNEYLTVPGIDTIRGISLPLPNALITVKRGLVLGTNRYQGRKHQARLTHPDRDTHVTIIGTTGVGKSTLMHNMIHQEIGQRKSVAVIEPHGDLITDVLRCSIPKKRAKDVILLNTFDEDCPFSLNPLEVPSGVSSHRVARQALDLIKKLCVDDWPGAQTERYFSLLLRALVEYPGATLLDAHKMLRTPAFRHQVLACVADEQVKQTWLYYDNLSSGLQVKIADPILNRLDRFHSDPKLERLICRPSSLDFRKIIDRGQIFLANLGAFQEEREANTLGALLLSKFQFAAMSRGELSKAERLRKTYYLYVDEIHRFNTASLPIMYDQARKFGLSITGSIQRFSQLSGDDLKGIAGGVGNLIAFSTLRDDARALAPFLGDQVTAADVAGLNKYTALASIRLNGQTLPSFSITTLAPPDENPEAEGILADIKKRNRADTRPSIKSQKAAAPEPPPSNEGDDDEPSTPNFIG